MTRQQEPKRSSRTKLTQVQQGGIMGPRQQIWTLSSDQLLTQCDPGVGRRTAYQTTQQTPDLWALLDQLDPQQAKLVFCDQLKGFYSLRVFLT